jgi:catechol 2,3-dioxygenase-like lactoylglutathione lyase family enzyme
MPRMIGRLHHVILDCPDPAALASFYSQLLGQPVVHREDDWAVVAPRADTSGLGFQRAPDHVSPRWPDPAYPQQFHLDVMVDDVEVADRQVRELGATRLPTADDTDHTYADPAGHPFCLIHRPAWAPPVHEGPS